MDRILEICRPHGVPVIEDAAEALGATYQGVAAGQRGDLAVFSFNGNKIITTSAGGMLASHNRDLIEKCRFWSAQARDPAPHYEHSELGYNYRMSNLLAAVGSAQLGVLENRVAAKRAIFARYAAQLGGLPGVSFMPEAAYGCSSRWLTVMLLEERCGALPEALRLALEQENMEARPVWKPMHLQPVFAGRGCVARRRGGAAGAGGTVSETLFRGGLCLPSGTGMSREELDRVCAVVKQVVQNYAGKA